MGAEGGKGALAAVLVFTSEEVHTLTQRQPLAIGQRVECTITEVKGTCSWGHKVGDKFEVSIHDTAGMCGFFYHDIFPSLLMLQFGGSFPWGERDVTRVECPDRQNCVVAELRRTPSPA